MGIRRQPTDPRPVNPNARNIRSAARAAGLEHLISSISTGRRTTYVWAHLGSDPKDGERLAEVLRPLWSGPFEGPSFRQPRVSVSSVSGTVFVDREDWHHTLPAARQATELTPANIKLATRTQGGWTVLEPGTFAVLGWVEKDKFGTWEGFVPRPDLPAGHKVAGRVVRRRDAIQAVINNRTLVTVIDQSARRD